ncbi:MAG: MOSC domain-containing protein [Opitutaceae bacterium]|nr:MOSC domain-containing protein [Verrucomicrobiales bacterium]
MMTQLKSIGIVASLHLHPKKSGESMIPVTSIDVEAGKGIVGNGRYFDRRNRTGQPAKRQVTLIERAQIADHGQALGILIESGRVRSNIETTGIDLIALIGQRVRVGTAILEFYEARTPCSKMDAICHGLRARMENERQGVLAMVIQPGRIAVGDSIAPVSPVAG